MPEAAARPGNAVASPVAIVDLIRSRRSIEVYLWNPDRLTRRAGGIPGDSKGQFVDVALVVRCHALTDESGIFVVPS